MAVENASHGAEVSVSDPVELRSLREHLRRIPGVKVSQIPGIPGSGEQGAWDVSHRPHRLRRQRGVQS